MTNYAAFIQPLKQLQQDLRTLSEQSQNAYSQNFIQALGNLANFLETACRQANPSEHVYSFSSLIEIKGIISDYIQLDINYLKIKIERIKIKDNCTIADEKMHQAIVKFKTAIEGYALSLGDDFKKNIVGETGVRLITDLNTTVSYELLRKQVEWDKIKFEEKYKTIANKIKALDSNHPVAEVNQLKQELVSFIREQDDYTNQFYDQNQSIINQYLDSYEDVELKLIKLFYFKTDDLMKKIDEYNHPCVNEINLPKREEEQLVEQQSIENSFVPVNDPLDELDKIAGREDNWIFTIPSIDDNLSNTTTVETPRSGSDETFSFMSSNDSLSVTTSLTPIPLSLEEACEQEAIIKQEITKFEEIVKSTDQKIIECNRSIASIANQEYCNLNEFQLIEDQLKEKQKELKELIDYLSVLINTINENKVSIDIHIDAEKWEQIKTNLDDGLAQRCDKVIGNPADTNKFKKFIDVFKHKKIKSVITDVKAYLDDQNQNLLVNLEKNQTNKTQASRDNDKKLKEDKCNLAKEQATLIRLNTVKDRNLEKIAQQQSALNEIEQTIQTLEKARQEALREEEQSQIDKDRLGKIEAARYGQLSQFYNELNQRKFYYEKILEVDFFNDKCKAYDEYQKLLQVEETDSERIKDKLTQIHNLQSDLENEFREVVINEIEHRINDGTTKITYNDIYTFGALISSKTTFFKSNYPVKDAASFELHLINKYYFGDDGYFTKHRNAIKGCASSLLAIIYTCLASVSFGHLNYQTELVFLDDLETTKDVVDKQTKIIQRLKDYPDTKLSSLLDTYHHRLNDVQTDSVTLKVN